MPHEASIPHLRAHGTATQLVVHDKPFLILGGELGNSTVSDLGYLEQYWPVFEALHLNTILAPVSWELIEPVEGQFDFSSVDGLIEAARAHNQKLVILWFGSWKNSMSSYVPAWVKRDQSRFPRAQKPDGTGLEILSPFSAENRDADMRAFQALMTHIRGFDGQQNTVIMVQVENEIGMIPSARDHRAAANARFAQDVPAELMAYLEGHTEMLAPELRQHWNANGRLSQGKWEHVFGRSVWTEEYFMAWQFARYVDAIASAGKAAYPLPMFVNAALVRPGVLPGAYPSAGPLPHLIDIWRAGAPSIDFLSPDIYFPNFVHWTSRYTQEGNPLFVPEAGPGPATPANGFYAIGQHDAIGFSPFAIEQYKRDDRLGSAYSLLSYLAPVILEHQGDGRMVAVRAPIAFDGTIDDAPQSVSLGGYDFHVSFYQRFRAKDQQNPAAHAAMIIQLGPEEFLIAGSGLTITFSTPGGIAGIESIWEGRYEDGVWQRGRLFNGDASHQGRHVRLSSEDFSVQRVKLYTYK
ncbi:MAG: beta-galactosidase [Robiginitomaculum sp.]|nr:MAG: beta-galactosidase [Robiginitomaculum sp.]